MGDVLGKCMEGAEEKAKEKAEEKAEELADEAIDKAIDEAKDKIVSAFQKTTHKVDDKTSKELLDGDWCVHKQGDGDLLFTKIEPCNRDVHKLADCDVMILKCSDGQDVKIDKECSRCKKHIIY